MNAPELHCTMLIHDIDHVLLCASSCPREPVVCVRAFALIVRVACARADALHNYPVGHLRLIVQFSRYA